MSNAASFAATPKNTGITSGVGTSAPGVQIATANTNRDGVTGTYGVVYVAGASGARLDAVDIVPVGTMAGTDVVRLFIKNASGARMLAEVGMTQQTPGNTVAANAITVQETWNGMTRPKCIILEAGASLEVSTNQGYTYNVTVRMGGDF
jgi:hypothetical protein